VRLKKAQEHRKMTESRQKKTSEYLCSPFNRIFYRSGRYYIKGTESEKFHRKSY
jgi:hypothetical protein